MGFGDLDLYKHDMESGSTELLGTPVNSFADDFGLNVDATGVGYMSSNREGGMDIYNLQLIDIIADFEITVVTCDDEVASNVEMDVLNLTTGREVQGAHRCRRVATVRTVVGETVIVVRRQRVAGRHGHEIVHVKRRAPSRTVLCSITRLRTTS